MGLLRSAADLSGCEIGYMHILPPIEEKGVRSAVCAPTADKPAEPMPACGRQERKRVTQMHAESEG